VVAEGLGKRYGDRWALRDVDLYAPAGSVLAVAGPEGAGKTTLLQILASQTPPTTGYARVQNDGAEVLLLDEPATGLDRGGRAELRSMLRRCVNGGGTVVLTAERLADVEDVADTVVLLDGGRVVRAVAVSAGRGRNRAG
jgi:ABC-type multidrug transport system ATPase subunit